MKRLLSICLSLCIMVSVFVSFDITASAKTTMKKTTVSVSNTSSGVNVSWKKVSGAKSYKVYRKAPGAKKYSAVKSTNNKTVKYLDKKVSVGKKYSYQVVAVNGKTKTTSKAKSIVRLLAPKNVKAQAYVKNTDCTVDYSNIIGGNFDDDSPYSVSGIKLTWTKSKGATKYDIYNKFNNQKYYYKVASTKNVSTYIDEQTYDAGTYYYKIVARNGSSTSAYSTVKKIVYVPNVTVSATAVTSGMKVQWDTADGCDGYKLYRSPNGKNGTYSLVSKFDKNKDSYLDKNVQLGKTYYYMIVAYKGSANSVGMTVKAKYQAAMTINVNVGETNDSIKKEVEATLKVFNKESDTKMTFEEFSSMFKIVSQNSSIATVSSDYIITGVSKGTTKAKAQVSLLGMTEEVGFILINVK